MRQLCSVQNDADFTASHANQKPNVVIIHGAYGHPEENWFGWMKRQLESQGVACHVPAFPTPDNQSLETWMAVFNESVLPVMHTNTILIGHSLGCAFILRWLERYQAVQSNASSENKNLPATIMLISAFIHNVGIEKFDSINQSFLHPAFQWDVIKQSCPRFISYHGTNDNYVSSDQFDEISTLLDAEKILIANAGHFNEASGYVQFPRLMLDIMRLVK